MSEFFEKIKDFFYNFKEFLWVILLTLFGGVIGGLGLYMGFMFGIYHYFWVIGFMCFFVLFHLGDLKGFVLEKNLIGFFGRLFCLYAISSFVCGFIAYMSGMSYVKSNSFTNYAFIFSFVISFAVSFIYFITLKYLPFSPLMTYSRKVLDWLFEVGVFWRY